MPTGDDQPLNFPLGGLHRGTEYELQPPGSTPVGVNVVGLDPTSRRLRGAARPGLARWIDAQPAGSASMIQELALIVTTDVNALLGSVTNSGGVSGIPPGGIGDTTTGISDPSTNTLAGGSTDPNNPLTRNPDRVIPDGGSGVQPNRHTPDPSGSGSHGWVHNQDTSVKIAFGGFPTRTDSLAYASPTTKNQFLIVVYATTGDGDSVSTNYDPTLACTDSLGNTYDAIASKYYDGGFPGFGSEILAMWSCRNAFGGANTVQVTQTQHPSAPGVINGARLYIFEYTGLETSTPNDGSATSSLLLDNGGTNPTGTLSTGAIPIGGSTRLILAAIYINQATVSPVLTTPAGYTARVPLGSGAGGNTVAIYEKLSSLSSETVDVVYDNTSLPFNGANIPIVGAGWRYR